MTELKLVKLRPAEINKLSGYRIHPREPYWEVVKALIEKVEATDTDNAEAGPNVTTIKEVENNGTTNSSG